jgi:hypothetical protein
VNISLSMDVMGVIANFETNLASVDGGAKARRGIRSLVAKQVMAAVENDLILLTKDNVGTIVRGAAVKIRISKDSVHKDSTQ